MRGATFSTRGKEISSPPGESFSHLAEIESPGEKKFPGGDSIRGQFHIGSPAYHVGFILRVCHA